MDCGASGGPVIDASEKVVGVITKSAVTTVVYPYFENPKKEVRSGSALAVSPHTIVVFLLAETIAQ